MFVDAVSGGRGLYVCGGDCRDLWFSAKLGEVVHLEPSYRSTRRGEGASGEAKWTSRMERWESDETQGDEMGAPLLDSEADERKVVVLQRPAGGAWREGFGLVMYGGREPVRVGRNVVRVFWVGRARAKGGTRRAPCRNVFLFLEFGGGPAGRAAAASTP